MSYFGEADIEAAYEASGVVVVSIADQWFTKGFVEVVDQTLLNAPGEAASLVGKVITVRVQTDKLGPNLAEGVDLTVGWPDEAQPTVYRVFSTAQVDDGAETLITILRK